MIGNDQSFHSVKPDTFLYGGPDDGREVYLNDESTTVIVTDKAVYTYDSLVQRYIYTKDSK